MEVIVVQTLRKLMTFLEIYLKKKKVPVFSVQKLTLLQLSSYFFYVIFVFSFVFWLVFEWLTLAVFCGLRYMVIQDSVPKLAANLESLRKSRTIWRYHFSLRTSNIFGCFIYPLESHWYSSYSWENMEEEGVGWVLNYPPCYSSITKKKKNGVGGVNEIKR